VEFPDHDWEFVADTPWGNVLIRGQHALLIVVDEENKEALEELATKISVDLLVERVAFPLDPPEIPEGVFDRVGGADGVDIEKVNERELGADYVPKGDLKVKGVVIGEAGGDEDEDDDGGGDLGILSRGIMGRSVPEDFIIADDPVEKPSKPLTGQELFPPIKGDDYDDR